MSIQNPSYKAAMRLVLIGFFIGVSCFILFATPFGLVIWALVCTVCYFLKVNPVLTIPIVVLITALVLWVVTVAYRSTHYRHRTR